MRGLLSMGSPQAALMTGLLGRAVQRPMADEGDEVFLRRYAQQGYEGQPRSVYQPPAAAPAAAPAAPSAAPRRPAPPIMSRGMSLLQFIAGGTDGVHQERERRRAAPMRELQAERLARLQPYIDSLSPDAQIAFMTNPEKLGEAFASRQEGRTLDQGDVYLEAGRPAYAAPFEAAPGSSIFNPLQPGAPVSVARSENKVAGGALVDPDGRVLYRGPQVEGVAATADAFLTPEVAQGQGGGAPQIVRGARGETVNLSPGGEVVTLDGAGNATNRVASSQAKPMSDADQAAVAKAETNIASLDTARRRAENIINLIDTEKLRLGPMTNAISGLQNATGNSSENSRNLADLQNWARQARDAILQANTGVQTDGDAVRALDSILSGVNDERLVKQHLKTYLEATEATRTALQRDIARRSATGPASSGGPIAEDANGNRVQWNGSAWVAI